MSMPMWRGSANLSRAIRAASHMDRIAFSRQLSVFSLPKLNADRCALIAI